MTQGWADSAAGVDHDATARPSDMGFPGWNLHPLKGTLRGHWAVSVSGSWRLTFRFDGSDVILVDYLDYH